MVVAASEADGDLSVSVVDHGLGLAPRPDSPGIGMGMPLMSQLSDKLEVQTSDGAGTEICMKFSLGARPSLTLAACPAPAIQRRDPARPEGWSSAAAGACRDIGGVK